MIEKKFLSILSCPRCKNSLQEKNNRLACLICRNTYTVAHGIPKLFLQKQSIDVQLSKDKWDKQYKEILLIETHKKNRMVLSQKSFLSPYKKYMKKGIFLDLGCGIAWQSFFLAQEGIPTIGIDISIEALLKSKNLLRRIAHGYNFIQADFLNVPLKDNSVSFIYWGLSIEYVFDTQRAINEAYRVLKKGGRVVVPFPVVSLSTLVYHQLRGGDIPRIPVLSQLMEFVHVTLLRGKYMHYGYGQTFTIGAMKAFFKRAGFHVEKVDYFDVYYPLALIPVPLRPLLQKLIHLRPFWPFAYLEATK